MAYKKGTGFITYMENGNIVLKETKCWYVKETYHPLFSTVFLNRGAKIWYVTDIATGCIIAGDTTRDKALTYVLNNYCMEKIRETEKYQRQVERFNSLVSNGKLIYLKDGQI